MAIGLISNETRAAVVGAGTLLALSEMAYLRRRDKAYPWRDVRLSIVSAVCVPIGSLITTLCVAGLFVWAWNHRIYTIPMNSWLSFLALFLVVEFFSYWYHRLSHTNRFMWASHAVHHSAERMVFVTSLRLPVTALLQGSWLFALPAVWMGFAPVDLFAVMALNVVYQYPLHTTLIPRLGPLEYILNTPVHHRIHHSSELDHLDTNYGATLIIFDRLFGTFKSDVREPRSYGWYGKPAATKISTVMFGAWAELMDDLCHSGSVWGGLKIIMSAPSDAIHRRGTAAVDTDVNLGVELHKVA